MNYYQIPTAGKTQAEWMDTVFAQAWVFAGDRSLFPDYATGEVGLEGTLEGQTPVRVAAIDGVITDAVNGLAYFPITTDITNTVRTLYFDVWVTDANAETYRIDAGKFTIEGGLR